MEAILGQGREVRAEAQEGGDQAVGRLALLQPTICLPMVLTLNLKSSWLVEPFMVNDWEKLRKKQREFRILRAYALAL